MKDSNSKLLRKLKTAPEFNNQNESTQPSSTNEDKTKSVSSTVKDTEGLKKKWHDTVNLLTKSVKNKPMVDMDDSQIKNKEIVVDSIFKTRFLLMAERHGRKERSASGDPTNAEKKPDTMDPKEKQEALNWLLSEGGVVYKWRSFCKMFVRNEEVDKEEEHKFASQLRHVDQFELKHSILETVHNPDSMRAFILMESPAFNIFHVLACILSIFDSGVWFPYIWSFYVYSNSPITGLQEGEFSREVYTADVCLQIAQLLFCFLRFFVSLCNINIGVEIIDISLISRSLLRNFKWWLTVIATTGSIVGSHYCQNFFIGLVVLFVRIVRAQTVWECYVATSIDGMSHRTRMAFLIISVLFVMHILACIWWLTFSYQGYEINGSFAMEDWSLIKRYGEALHDTSYMLFGSPPANTGRGTAELLISALLGTVGQLYFAYVMAKLVEIVSQMGILNARRNENMSIINAAVISLNLPKYLIKRILFYHHFRNTNADESVHAFLFDSLSLTLVTELKLFLFRTLFNNAPFFQDVPKVVINRIVVTFTPFVYSPGDIIIRSGEIGTHMYFILQGLVDVFINQGTGDEENVQIISTRVAGDYFGEIALIYQQLRSASVRAQSYCLLANLSRTSLDAILVDHPRVRRQLVRRIMKWDVKKPPVEDDENDQKETKNQYLVTKYQHNSVHCEDNQQDAYGDPKEVTIKSPEQENEDDEQSRDLQMDPDPLYRTKQDSGNGVSFDGMRSYFENHFLPMFIGEMQQIINK